MMDFIRTWLIGIVGAGLAAALTRMLTPPGAIRQVVQVAGGLIVLLTVVRPLTQNEWQILPRDRLSFEQQAEQYAVQAKQAGETVMKKIIEDKTSAYIENEAKIRGLSLKVVVEARQTGGEENFLPFCVTLTSIKQFGEQEKHAFSNWIEQTLNIPIVRQRWKEGG